MSFALPPLAALSVPNGVETGIELFDRVSGVCCGGSGNFGIGSVFSPLGGLEGIPLADGRYNPGEVLYLLIPSQPSGPTLGGFLIDALTRQIMPLLVGGLTPVAPAVDGSCRSQGPAQESTCFSCGSSPLAPNLWLGFDFWIDGLTLPF